MASKPLNDKQRELRARAAAHAMHAKHDPKETTAKARAAFLSKFELEVDPDGTLEPEERARRAEHARKSHFARMALARSRARQNKAAS